MSESVTPLILFEDVSFWYDPAKKLLEKFNWAVQPSESWSIVGPSGCGKSTLLYLIAGLRQTCSGHVYINGQKVTGPSQDVALMLQDYGLLNWYTAAQNVELGLRIRNIAKADRKARLGYWFRELAIDTIRDHYPLKISGGQRQRVALARLLALQAPVQLLDEPLSAVDELTRERLQRQLAHINQKQQTCMLTVTHNIEEAVLLSDKVLVITDYAPIMHFHIERSVVSNQLERNAPQFIAVCDNIRRLLVNF